MRTVVLLTAGTGSRMGKYAEIINKSLLPINEQAIISHIINQFDVSTRFIVALGFLGEQVQQYLSLAHPDRDIQFVTVDVYEGPNSGPARSLKCCRSLLSGPFTLIACDAMYENLSDFPSEYDCLGVTKIGGSHLPYCSIGINERGVVNQVVDKQECELEYVANGLFNFYSVDKFFANLDNAELSSGFKFLSLGANEINWVDLGTFEKYQKYYLENSPYDFSKTDEFFFNINGRVIKWFKDADITKNRILRSTLRPGFPHVDKSTGGFYSYELVEGQTLYQHCTSDIFQELLDWMQTTVWPLDKSNDGRLTANACKIFYKDKTMKRLDTFKRKYPDFNPVFLNGTKILYSIDEALSRIDWDSIINANLEQRSAFIHGDFQFDNILHDGKTFTMLDWRQDFAGDLVVGDLYYDIAKLIGGLIINYDLMKKNLFNYEEQGQHSYYFVPQRSYGPAFISTLYNHFPAKIIDQIVSLIFLNMAPLHAAPFDKILYCLALERLNAPN